MKKLLSAILTVLMLLSASPTVFATVHKEQNFYLYQNFREDKTFVLGDANSDREVNAEDANVIRKYVAGYGTTPAADASDIQADGEINARDLFYLKASFVGSVPLVNLENGKQVYKFVIGGEDISKFTIVLPEGTTYDDNIYFAYELLWQYTEKATGVKLPMVYGETESEHGIYYHNVDKESELGKELCDDGYRYEVKNGNLHIYGTYRGNMYATYEILEDYLGFFFCENYYTFQYKKRYVELEEGMEHQFVPPLKMRFTYKGFWGSTCHFFSYARGNNGNAYGHVERGTTYYGGFVGGICWNCHSFCKLQAMGAGTMPEEGTLNADGSVMSLADRYYAKFQDGLVNGVINGKVSSLAKMDEHGPQPCTSSADEYANIFEGLVCTVEYCKAREDTDFFMDEGMHYISFSINDNTDYCTCSVCRAKAEGRAVKMAGDRETVAKQLESYTGDYDIGQTQRNRTEVTFRKEGDNGIYLDMMNRATKDIRKLYPNLRLYQIIYTPGIPETVRPEKNNVFHYCAEISGCFRHHYGDGNTDLCKADPTTLPKEEPLHSAKDDEESIKDWLRICHENDCELQYWIYPENYSRFMYDLPFYYKLYNDVHWLYEQGIDGINYEGMQSHGADMNLELTKAYIASELLFNPAMTFDEYVETTKKYLRVRYGPGYEHIFNYMIELEEVSAETDFCCTYWYGLFDFYGKKEYAAHYESLRNELLMAVEMSDDTSRHYCKLLLAMCDFAGLSSIYDTKYVNGTAEERKMYEERYYSWYQWMTENNITAMGDPAYADIFKFPDKPDLTQSPCMQIYHSEYRFGAHN